MKREIEHLLRPDQPADDLDGALVRLSRTLDTTLETCAALAARESRYRALFEDAAQGAVVHRGWQILCLNAACARLLGYPDDQQAAAVSLERHVAEHDRERAGSYLAARGAGHAAPRVYEIDALRRDGSQVSLHVVSHTIDWDDGAATHSTFTDLTRRKEVEQSLRWSERRFKDFTEAAGDWLWETDEALRLTYLSRRFTELTGLEASDFVGSDWGEIAGHAGDGSPRGRVGDVVDARAPFRDLDLTVLDGTGRRRCLRLSGLPTFGPGGAFQGYRGTGVERTEHLAAEARVEAAERRLLEAMGHIRDGYALFDRDDRLVLCNRTWREVLNREIADVLEPGVRFEEALRTSLAREVLVLPVGDGVDTWARRRLAHHRAADGEPFEVEHADGRWQLVREFKAADGGTMVVASDATESKSREQALVEGEQRFRDFAETAADWFWEVDAEGRLTYLSERFEAGTGLAAERLLGLAPHERDEMLHLDEEEARVLAARLAAREPFEDVELTIATDSESEPRVHRLGGRPWFDAQGGFCGFRGTGADVTSDRRHSRQMAFQASHDALTGLVNRREFENRLARVIETARADDSEHALCYLDLDKFKIINDTCGHLAGDELLRRLANLLLTGVRRRDTLARLGGDEFGVLMEHCGLLQARRVGDALRKTVESFRFHWDGRTFAVGVSIGLVSIDRLSGDAGDVMRAADSACYAAKDQGRNRIHVHAADDDARARRSDEMQWHERIGHALDHDAFALDCQAIAPIESGRADGPRYELLLRMKDADGAPIPPGAFLPSAERYGLAERIDRWVVSTALAWLAGHPLHLDRLSLCALNLSAPSLASRDFGHFVEHQLDQTGVAPEKICFELTESAVNADLTGAIAVMRALKGRGCRFALDDFGSGLASFAYLRSLPVDFLKIDGSFVRAVAKDPVGAAMVRSINDVGQAMGCQTIAEYVESAAILESLSAIGVNYAQGYHVARPRPLDEVA